MRCPFPACRRTRISSCAPPERSVTRPALAAGATTGVTIRVEKRIPIGGGLGGGSSDAATTLIALNELWGARLPRSELARLALGLGADVPFFLLGRNAFAEGIGEVLTPLDLAPAWYVVITPQVAVSTREIFASNALTRNTKPLKITAFFAGLGANDLEAETCRRYPQVARGAALAEGVRRCADERLGIERVRGVRIGERGTRGRSEDSRGLARRRGPRTGPASACSRIVAGRIGE